MKISFNDLRAQYLDIKPQIDAVISDVIQQSLFVRGPYVEKFEQKFSNLQSRKYCVSCGNGTDSLYIAMKSLDVRAGDEVICPAHSWISTSETITQAGGKVVFCDTDLDTFTMDPRHLNALITDKTVGIIPVHLFGQPADMDPILKIAEKNSLWVIEDCAQAHLAEYRGKQVGTFGNAGSFSFYPGKNLGAMGDAGCVITDDKDLSIKMSMFARHGGLVKGQHLIEGINSRMDGLQAAVLSVKIDYLREWTERRKYIADYYLKNINNTRISLPKIVDYSSHVWHLFVIKCDERNELQNFLQARGIETMINYPIALPFLPAYKKFAMTSKMFPNSHYNQSRVLSLPIYPELKQHELDYVVETLNAF